MAQDQQRASIRDVLNYKPEEYLSPAELALIRNTFAGSPALIKVLRKLLIPTFADPDTPLEDFGNDAWLAGRDYGAIPESEIKSIVLARQEALKFIVGGLIKLKVIAATPEPTAAEIKEAQRRGSSK